MASYARTERTALVHLLTDLGPDAPTLCDGWSTRDLAAHLVMRERHPAALGLAVRALAPRTESVRRRTAARPYSALLRAIATGPPRWSPLRPVDRLANTVEFFVHHEDVRRARDGWSVRSLPPTHERALWRMVRPTMRRLLRAVPAPQRPAVVLSPTGRPGVRIGGTASGTAIDVTGDAGELLLFAFGRQSHARVHITGPADAIEVVRRARLSG